ncbi:beta-3-deoxy-D-manno-oct-2-ulosonic acid transferase [Gemmobacter aquarius]|uniref:Beta-3-deoxy-D-manno-oct-2-ulosonic acid transferase n=1 Tax=Paragemmobacter aquarius TaxID=2169400 RepID=A0A2S0UMP8_9RHOB|nr:capsular polysaccharide biosynthesis protein [Gemmobacter aquarius]AWB49087.1 beta-3-deoxy-D-manno-oct-2-ulosonic acid transferase [Gemmobacter aquarius]
MSGLAPNAAEGLPRRLYFYNGGFLNPRLRRILSLAGHELCLGLPRPGDGVTVWGKSPTAKRGEAVALRHNAPLIRVEDAFLRSLRPGRAGDAPLGLLIDPYGLHFDPSAPSLIERIAATHPLDDTALLARARDGIARLQASDLSKYNLHDPALAAPAPGYVLVIDQTRDDASIRHSGATAQTFAEMLATAMADHPSARILVKSHPETSLGLRRGHFDATTLPANVTLLSTAVSPWALLQGAIAVYAVSSQLGFEAILAGHRPRLFGAPFYAGWGLTTDSHAFPRRKRNLTRAQLFAVAMILAPRWYDPCRDRLCSFEQVLDQLEAETRAFRQDRNGHVALGMRLWKRSRLQQVFGREIPLIFAATPQSAAAKARKTGRPLLVWASKATGLPPDLPTLRVEDGFLRSRGLGADLVAPLSLVTDDLGIYYDPTRESRLERLIMAPPPPGGLQRAKALVDAVTRLNLTKYNLSGTRPDLPPQGGRRRILIVGQVEDDASIRLGTTGISTNLALLHAARSANPEAILIFKPHPDVEAGLRSGAVPPESPADITAAHADPTALIDACDEVWTMTSLLGFEALLRGKPVTCLGAPFYAGWGLTRDLGDIPARRLRLPDGSRRQPVPLLHLAHAALIAYPRYYDPVSRRPCPPEVAIDRLASGTLPKAGPLNRALAKAQGALARYPWLWR